MHFLNPTNITCTHNIYKLSSEEKIFIIRVHVYYFTIRRKVNSVLLRASIIVYNFASEVLVYMKLIFNILPIKDMSGGF